MANTTGSSTHSTDDLALAAYLYSLKFELISLDRSKPDRVVFVFEIPDTDWDKYTGIWREGAPQRLYYSSYQALKGRIFHDKEVEQHGNR